MELAIGILNIVLSLQRLMLYNELPKRILASHFIFLFVGYAMSSLQLQPKNQMYQGFQRYLNGKYREVFTLSKDIHYLNETLFKKIFKTGDQQPINVLIQLASFFNKRIPRLLHVPFMRSYARCRGKLYMWFWVNQLEILDYLKESPIEGSWRMVRFRKYDSSKVGLYKGQKIVD